MRMLQLFKFRITGLVFRLSLSRRSLNSMQFGTSTQFADLFNRAHTETSETLNPVHFEAPKPKYHSGTSEVRGFRYEGFRAKGCSLWGEVVGV